MTWLAPSVTCLAVTCLAVTCLAVACLDRTRGDSLSGNDSSPLGGDRCTQGPFYAVVGLCHRWRCSCHRRLTYAMGHPTDAMGHPTDAKWHLLRFEFRRNSEVFLCLCDSRDSRKGFPWKGLPWKGLPRKGFPRKGLPEGFPGK